MGAAGAHSIQDDFCAKEKQEKDTCRGTFRLAVYGIAVAIGFKAVKE